MRYVALAVALATGRAARLRDDRLLTRRDPDFELAPGDHITVFIVAE